MVRGPSDLSHAMGNKAMFDLENAIRDWNIALQNTESVSRDDLLELEEHLRQTVDDLTGKGLTQQEAFGVAMSRLGSSASLGDEFSKVNGHSVWQSRISWMLFGYVGVSALANAINGISRATGTVSSLAGLSGASSAVVATVFSLACWAIFMALLYRLSNQSGAGWRFKRISVGVLAALCATMVIGRGIATVGSIFHVQGVESAELGEYALWSTFGSMGVAIFVVAGCVGMILAIRNKSAESLSVVK